MSSNNEKTVNLIINRSNFINNLLIFIIIVSLFFYFSDNSLYLDTEDNCKFRWSQSNYDTKFNFRFGCLIKVDDVWVKEDNIKFNIINNQPQGKQ